MLPVSAEEMVAAGKWGWQSWRYSRQMGTLTLCCMSCRDIRKEAQTTVPFFLQLPSYPQSVSSHPPQALHPQPSWQASMTTHHEPLEDKPLHTCIIHVCRICLYLSYKCTFANMLAHLRIASYSMTCVCDVSGEYHSHLSTHARAEGLYS